MKMKRKSNRLSVSFSFPCHPISNMLLMMPMFCSDCRSVEIRLPAGTGYLRPAHRFRLETGTIPLQCHDCRVAKTNDESWLRPSCKTLGLREWGWLRPPCRTRIKPFDWPSRSRPLGWTLIERADWPEFILTGSPPDTVFSAPTTDTIFSSFRPSQCANVDDGTIELRLKSLRRGRRPRVCCRPS